MHRFESSSTSYGANGPVFRVKAFPWQDLYGGSLHAGGRVLVGGRFSSTGTVSTGGFSIWQQGAVVTPGWSTPGALDNSDGSSGGPTVYGIAGLTSTGGSGETTWAGIWLTGAFGEAIGGSQAIHVVRIDSGAYAYIGKGFLDETGSSPFWRVYPSFFGYDAEIIGTTIINSTIYFGGFGEAYLTTGNNLYTASSGYMRSLQQIPAYSSILTSTVQFPGTVECLAAQGSDLYASGGLEVGGTGTSYARKVSGSWDALPTSNAPSGIANSAAASSSYVYYVSIGSVYRYNP